MTTSAPPAPPASRGRAARTPVPRAAYVNLVVATLGFGVTFWAWNLVAPLAGELRGRLGVGAFAQSFMVAVPVIVGSLGRIPAGAMTDRFGARVMFPAVSALTIVPVLLMIPAQHSYWSLIVVGFVLGIGGTTFAIGIPLVNAWFPASRRGMALGVFGMGMGGTAFSGYFSPRIARHGADLPFLVVAGCVAVYCLLAVALLRDRPGRQVPATPLAARLAQACRLRVTWELSALYAIGFGGIVAYGTYLPTYLKTWYHLAPTDAGARAAGFAVVTVIGRPLGGWLSDRVHPAVVTCWSLAGTALFAVCQAFAPGLEWAGTVFLLLTALGLGVCSGAVFALVSQVTPQGQVGSVTGIVGAVGGLGGFVPPLVMGAIYTAQRSYAIGFMLLSELALAGAVYAVVRMRVRTPG